MTGRTTCQVWSKRNPPIPATHTGEKFTQGELEWRHIGSGVFARAFPKAKNMATTTKNGPPIQEVYKRKIWSLFTGRIIDECHMDDFSDEVFHRPLQHPDNIRVELTMREALELFNASDADISEVYSQPRVAQEAGVQGNN